MLHGIRFQRSIEGLLVQSELAQLAQRVHLPQLGQRDELVEVIDAQLRERIAEGAHGEEGQRRNRMAVSESLSSSDCSCGMYCRQVDRCCEVSPPYSSCSCVNFAHVCSVATMGGRSLGPWQPHMLSRRERRKGK